jgi:hypothetical protein
LRSIGAHLFHQDLEPRAVWLCAVSQREDFGDHALMMEDSQQIPDPVSLSASEQSLKGSTAARENVAFELEALEFEPLKIRDPNRVIAVRPKRGRVSLAEPRETKCPINWPRSG